MVRTKPPDELQKWTHSQTSQGVFLHSTQTPLVRQVLLWGHTLSLDLSHCLNPFPVWPCEVIPKTESFSKPLDSWPPWEIWSPSSKTRVKPWQKSSNLQRSSTRASWIAAFFRLLRAMFAVRIPAIEARNEVPKRTTSLVGAQPPGRSPSSFSVTPGCSPLAGSFARSLV